LNYVSYLAHTIRDVYPDRYIPTSGASITTIEPFLDTEMKMRTEEVLVELGLSFQAELEVSGRFIDFLVGDDVVLELDGIHHFNLNSLQMTDKSQSRNLHFLFKGYKVVLINIYEYNLAREIGELKQLLTAKMALLKEKDAVMVM
jgi:very-short-patch-repair endonuclease